MANPIIEYPSYGNIDWERFVKNLKLEKSSTFSNEKLVEGLTQIIDGIIQHYVTNSKIKVDFKLTKNYAKWELKKYEGYLAIYLKNNCDLTYTVRLNTTNSSSKKTYRYAYFLGDKMECYVDTLFIRVLRDFSELIYEFNKLPYAFESCGDDPPRQTYLDDGSWFCNEHENKLTRPRHYYKGIINYEKPGANQLSVGHEIDFSEIESKN